MWTDQTRPETDSIPEVVMIVHGGALERARALDLGTDDVISFPFDAAEFAARIRTQFRERWPEEELKTMLECAVQREGYADIAVESLSGRGINCAALRDFGVSNLAVPVRYAADLLK